MLLHVYSKLNCLQASVSLHSEERCYGKKGNIVCEREEEDAGDSGNFCCSYFGQEEC